MRRSRARSRFITLLAFLAVAGQLAVSVIAPLADGRAGRDAPAHAEAQGITKHYAHNESTCVACVASTLLSRLPVPLASPVAIVRAAETPPAAAAPRRPLLSLHEGSPRAPPVMA